MTRQMMLKTLREIGAITEEDAVAAAIACLLKHQRGEKLTQSEAVTCGLLWSEFLADDQYSDAEQIAAAVNCNWLRRELNLDAAKLYEINQQYFARH